INETDFRHYTPSVFDIEKGICEVLFYLHGKGPGSSWAANLKVGDNVKLMGLGGKMKYQPENPFHFFFGDETSMGVCHQLKSAVYRDDREYLCLLELEKEYQNWPAIVGMEAEVVNKPNGQKESEAVQSIMALNGNMWKNWQHGVFYLTGRARSVQAVRNALRQKGVSPKQIISYAYWVEGKKGL
ncbi:MAG: siderophore-interacting protein, partial [Bacteroidota bacterium]